MVQASRGKGEFCSHCSQSFWKNLVVCREPFSRGIQPWMDLPMMHWFRNLPTGVFHPSKVVFHSDVYIALLSFTMGNPGAVLISGTGSMACGIDAEGVYHTAGGWGQVLGDEGSGLPHGPGRD